MSGDPIDMKEFKRERARREGALVRSTGVDFHEYVDVGSVVDTGQAVVLLDNSQHAGFAMTPDEADALAALLRDKASEARGGED